MSAIAPAVATTHTRYAVLTLVFTAALITYLDRVCISVAAPLMQAEMGLSVTQFGLVFTAFYVAYSICEIPASWLGDRWGQRVTLVRIVGCWSLFTMLTGLTRGLTQLVITRFAFGAAEAGAFPTLARALARWFPIEERSRAIGVMWTGARLGGAISPALAVVVIGWVGWRASFAIFGATGFVWCAICWLWFRDDPATHPGVNPAELALIRSAAAPSPKPTERVPWGAIFRNRSLTAMFGTYICSGFGFQFFVTWMPTYLTKEHGLSLQQSGFYSSLPLAAGAVGCVLGGVIADAIGRATGSIKWGRRIVGSCAFFFGAAGFVMAIFARSPEAAIAALVLASGAHDLTLPVLWASSVDAGGRFGGTAAGYINFASCISGMVAPMASALLSQRFGSFAGVFYVAAAIYVIGGLLWFLIDPNETL